MNPEHATTRPPRSPHGGAAPPPTLLYARPGIIVTADRFTVGSSSWRVAELTHVHTTRGPHDRVATRAVLISASMIVGAGLVLGFTGGLHRLTAGAYLLLGAVFLVPVLLAAAGDRWRPPAHELWGRRGDTEELLFSSDDEQQFGQVTRALRRAREMNSYGGWDDPLATVQPWRPRR
ncbi:DUF6232 family protein [Micromonospora endophytica]|uniref:Uncharacterized protein n=1 Tax=Micromonospora endophytica TaxID=515350 RepID=A0A2W2DMT5_9ACTN|nr:DUF6232 family protein [Micromonospora endophytica]PZF98446.1 hypothetical protein C1I93_08940 [Micromonospora endophytica]RIW50876.1 hypothetical protein D3H59_01850 [Micromonospora endophytica]